MYAILTKLVYAIINKIYFLIKHETECHHSYKNVLDLVSNNRVWINSGLAGLKCC